MKKILITGSVGFIGVNAAHYFSNNSNGMNGGQGISRCLSVTLERSMIVLVGSLRYR